VSNEYKAHKNGKPLRKNSKYPYESALRTCTKTLKAKGRVRCGKIVKKGRKLYINKIPKGSHKMPDGTIMKNSEHT